MCVFRKLAPLLIEATISFDDVPPHNRGAGPHQNEHGNKNAGVRIGTHGTNPGL